MSTNSNSYQCVSFQLDWTWWPPRLEYPEWEPAGIEAPECIPVSVPGLAPPRNGFIDAVYDAGDGQNNKVAVFGCNEGYRLNGTSPVQTTIVGGVAQWPALPSCVAKSCGPIVDEYNDPVTLAYGSITYSNEQMYPSAASLTCNANYILSDPRKATAICKAEPLDSGATGWRFNNAGYYTIDPNDVTMPTCTKLNCTALAVPTDGKVVYGYISSGYQTATYSCNPGYFLTTDGATNTTTSIFYCVGSSSSSWVPKAVGANAPDLSAADNVVFPWCKAASCGDPKVPANMDVSTTNNGMYPSTAFYSCAGEMRGVVQCAASGKTAYFPNTPSTPLFTCAI